MRTNPQNQALQERYTRDRGRELARNSISKERNDRNHHSKDRHGAVEQFALRMNRSGQAVQNAIQGAARRFALGLAQRLINGSSSEDLNESRRIAALGRSGSEYSPSQAQRVDESNHIQRTDQELARERPSARDFKLMHINTLSSVTSGFGNWYNGRFDPNRLDLVSADASGSRSSGFNSPGPGSRTGSLSNSLGNLRSLSSTNVPGINNQSPHACRASIVGIDGRGYSRVGKEAAIAMHEAALRAAMVMTGVWSNYLKRSHELAITTGIKGIHYRRIFDAAEESRIAALGATGPSLTQSVERTFGVDS